jgi:hypothetical protein
MKSAHRATKISIAVTMGIVYPFVVVGDVLNWPAPLELGLGALLLVTLVGTKVALTDWDEWRADRARMRRERTGRG